MGHSIPFMAPYWGTVALAVAYLTVYWIYDGWESEFESARKRRILRRVTVGVGVFVVIGVLVGFWLPFFIPGLYG